MMLRKPLFIALLVWGGLVSQALPALAVRVKYSIDFFSVPSDLYFKDGIQKVIGSNNFRYENNETLVEKSLVGSGFFTYDTDNRLPLPIDSSGTIFEIDELSFNLRGKSLTLNDFAPKVYSIGTPDVPLENGSNIYFQLNRARFLDPPTGKFVPKLDPRTGLPTTPNLIIIQSFFGLNQYGNGCIFPATRCLEELSSFDSPEINPPLPPSYPPRQYTDVYPLSGSWRWFDEGTPGAFGGLQTDQGYFFTSLLEPKQVPEPSALILEIVGSLLIFFGAIRSRVQKKFRAE